MRGVAVAVIVIAVVLTTAITAQAQDEVGIRAGVSGSPDQFVFGGHLQTSPLLDQLVFRPNVEIGVGDDVTLFAVNLEFAYRFVLADSAWTPYAGAGPALVILNYDESRRRRDDVDYEGGFNVLVGVQHEGGLFTEAKVGAGDSPDIKWVVGYAF